MSVAPNAHRPSQICQYVLFAGKDFSNGSALAVKCTFLFYEELHFSVAVLFQFVFKAAHLSNKARLKIKPGTVVYTSERHQITILYFALQKSK